MELEELIVILVVGGIAGWLAGLIIKGRGFGLIGDLIIGVLGAFLGGWLFGALGISIGSGLASLIVTATIGAVVLLFLIKLIKKG